MMKLGDFVNMERVDHIEINYKDYCGDNDILDVNSINQALFERLEVDWIKVIPWPFNGCGRNVAVYIEV